MDAIVAVLAGGRSSRIGEPKAGLELAGQPLISYPLAAAADGGLEAFVVAKPDSGLPAVEVPVIEEPAEPCHPLNGIISALWAVQHDLVPGAGHTTAIVAVACDMPFVDGKLLAWLASFKEPLVVPEVDGMLQPLLARYDDSLLGDLERALGRDEPLQRTVMALEPRVVPEEALARFGDPAKLSFNINTRDDLIEARHAKVATR